VSRFLLFVAFPCCIAAFVQGELAFVQGELFVMFEFWFSDLHSLFEHDFVSDVSSCCPFLRGTRLVFFSDLALHLSLAFDRLLRFLFICFFSFSFSIVLFHVGVVNALIKGEIEDHVWFEDRWMVASLCDE
jgi:hypothetical protein